MRMVSGEREYLEQTVLWRVALATCRDLPDLDEDTRRLIAPLAVRGISATPAIWDDPDVDWTRFDLVVVRSCWDYVPRRDEFLEWAARVPSLANPATVLAWNTHKRYLQELAGRDIPIVPTKWLQPEDEWTPPERGDWVIKPAVSMASLDTGRYRLDDRNQRHLAVEHVRRLHGEGRAVMVQPYMRGMDNQGETSLVYTLFGFTKLGGPRQAIAQIPGGTLDPISVPKYVLPMLIPPVMPRAGTIKLTGGKNADYYEISMKQFAQQILPSGLPPTTVWGYGAVTSASKRGLLVHTRRRSPSKRGGTDRSA